MRNTKNSIGKVVLSLVTALQH